jgi:beta-lactamase class A
MKFSIAVLVFIVSMSLACLRPPGMAENELPIAGASPTPVPHPPEKIDRELERAIAEIAQAAKGKVGVGAVLLETGDAAYLDRNGHYAMQSVYKLPIAMAVAQMIDRGTVRFDSDISITPDDYVRRGYHSPIRNLNPRGTVMRLDDIIRYSLSESDGSANDVLLDLAGGPAKVQEYLGSIGVTDMMVADSTKAISMDWDSQYRNWASPDASVKLLIKLLDRQAGLSERTNSLVLSAMTESGTGRHRIHRGMPDGAILAHKTGTGGRPSEVPGYWKKMAETNANVSNTNANKNARRPLTHATPTPKPTPAKKSKVNAVNRDIDSEESVTETYEITSAVNDIGIITLPDGRHIILAVYINDSVSDGSTREHVIADIAKAVCDRWTTGQLPDLSRFNSNREDQRTGASPPS